LPNCHLFKPTSSVEGLKVKKRTSSTLFEVMCWYIVLKETGEQTGNRSGPEDMDLAPYRQAKLGPYLNKIQGDMMKGQATSSVLLVALAEQS
jgi:hypothetical protein